MTHGSAETVTLTHGAVMPRLGLGTSPMDDAETERAVALALEAGYRLVDTAENYGNERGVGQGLRASGVPREDVFVTTKFNKRGGLRTQRQTTRTRIHRPAVDSLAQP
jgi:2,5-diketo-D-gluconate reductase A